MKLKENSNCINYLKLKNSIKKNRYQIQKKNKLNSYFEILQCYVWKSRKIEQRRRKKK
jgi:hypothetical protein